MAISTRNRGLSQIMPDYARLCALGKTDEERRLHITFTLQRNKEKIRVISA